MFGPAARGDAAVRRPARFTELAATLEMDPLFASCCPRDGLPDGRRRRARRFRHRLLRRRPRGDVERADRSGRSCRAGLPRRAANARHAARRRGRMVRRDSNAELRLGIGIHTGIVQVGNAGSSACKKVRAARAERASGEPRRSGDKGVGVPLVAHGQTGRAAVRAMFAPIAFAAPNCPACDKPVDLVCRCCSKSAMPTRTASWQSY